MEKKELLPCPSCKNKPILETMEYSECSRPFGDRFLAKVTCQNCDTTISSDFEDRLEDATYEATRLWNSQQDK